ncbi:hypothetical protein [Actinoplanes sp. NPDC023714]|uniref:hypothetical protein n=1 Tax=Actinoplanes sp. NPDC023714 TaxID=3154322 RepID=UPI003403A7DA
MPLPAELSDHLENPDFWRVYFFEAEYDELFESADGDDDLDDGGDDSAGGLVAEFPVGGGYALVVDIDLEIGSIELGLKTPKSDDPLELGWDDQAHWHPHALRWSELDLIARSAAVLDPALPHPGPVLALAGRFVVLARDQKTTTSDPGELDAITPLMDAAYGPPPPGAEWWPTARDWLYRADFRRDATTWRQDRSGDWTVEQDENENPSRGLYSLRHPDGDFPLKKWRKLLAAAESTLAAGPLPAPRTPAEQCWTDEIRTGVPRGSLIAAHFGPSPLRNARMYPLSLTIPVENRYSVAKAVFDDLDRVLRRAARGEAEITGSTSRPGYGYTDVSADLEIFDDLEAGLTLIREVLSSHGVPAGTRLTRNGEDIPLT